MNLPLVSYGLAACAYFGSAVLLLGSSKSNPAARWVVAATGITALWAAVLALDAYAPALRPGAVGLIDVVRYAAWFGVLRSLSGAALPAWLYRGIFGVCAALFVLMVLLPAAGVTRIVSTGGLLLALMGLVQIEQLVRNAPPATRVAMKLAAVGIGGQFFYDLCLYSQAQLLGGIEPVAWIVRGLAFVLLLPAIVLAVRRLGAFSSVVFVSRHAVFYTGSLIAIGGYLSVMAVGGYYVRAHGGSWGESLQLLFLFGAAVVLASLLLSATLWRRFKVFIATHFYRNKFDYRIEWLRFIQTLSSDRNRGGDGDVRRVAIQAVAQIFNCPEGVLFMREGSGASYMGVCTWSETGISNDALLQLPVGAELPRFLEDRQWIVDVEEFLRVPDLYGNIQLPAWLIAERAWRIVTPLLLIDRLVGFLVLRAPPPPFHLTYEDLDLFKTVGRHVALQLAQYEADNKLTASRQFDAYNRFTAFVMHDLKNSVAQLQLLVRNAARHRENPEFIDDAISTIANTVDRMTGLIGQLQSRDLHGQLRDVALAQVLAAAVTRCEGRGPAPSVEHHLDGAIVRADAEKLGAILDHIIRNAQEATGADGKVIIRMYANGDQVRLEIQDDGPGMDPTFLRDRLFRPFDGTKGSKGMGIGAYQTREYVRQLNGDVEVQSSPGRGTTFCIRLPLCPPHPES